MNIAVAGDTGLLGQALVKALCADHQVLGLSRAALKSSRLSAHSYAHVSCDLLDGYDQAVEHLNAFKPRILINAIALADVVACEADPKLAEHLNMWIPERLAVLAKKTGARFCHISTDAVFDGTQRKPYTETDLPRPTNIYAASKWAGEKLVLSENKDALVVRTNIVGFRGLHERPTFAEWLCRALHDRAPIRLAEDFITSSIHVDSLARLIRQAVAHPLNGLYHIVSGDHASKWELGRQLAAEVGADFSKVEKVKLAELGLRPPRPAYLALDTSKASRALGQAMPPLAETVRALAADYREHYDKEKAHVAR